MKKLLILLVVLSLGCKKKDDTQPTGGGAVSHRPYSRYYNTMPQAGLIDTIYFTSTTVSKLIMSSVEDFGATYPYTMTGDTIYIPLKFNVQTGFSIKSNDNVHCNWVNGTDIYIQANVLNTLHYNVFDVSAIYRKF